MKKLIYTLAAIGLGTSAAYAQADTEAAPADLPAAEAPAPAEAAPAPADAVPAPAEPAAAPAVTADAAASAYTDAEVESFAKATVKIQAISADTALDATAKQAQMSAAVTEAGLEPAKYNEIGKALSSDPALLARVQAAIGSAG